MLHTPNGWPASENPSEIGINPDFQVAGRSFPGGVKSGPAGVCIKYAIVQLHLRVESLYYGPVDKDDWAYSFRRNKNNPSILSEHSGGTAFDFNAEQHPNGVRNTFSSTQVYEIRRILKEVPVFRWGGDFSTTKDEQHFEIIEDLATVTAVSKRLLSPRWYVRDLIPVGDTAEWQHGADVLALQKRLKVTATGKYDVRTVDAVKRTRARLALPVSGRVTKDFAFYIGAAA